MAPPTNQQWHAAQVRTWLASRTAAARVDQVVAERAGRDRQDDCDKASAEELVCSIVAKGAAADARDSFVAALRSLLDREEYIWRGVYNDTRFDRHVRAYVKKLIRMTKSHDGFANIAHYQ